MQSLSTPSRPALPDFLVVALYRLRHVPVDDVADVRLVDAHAEGNGCTYDVDVIADESVLHDRAIVGLHACVIGECFQAKGGKVLSGALGRCSRQGVHDAALTATIDAQPPDRLSSLDAAPVVVALLEQVDLEVWSEERAPEALGVHEPELVFDITGNFRVAVAVRAKTGTLNRRLRPCRLR